MASVLVSGPAAAGDRQALGWTASSPYRRLIGVGGIGEGMFFSLDGERTLRRNESRSGRLIDARDYCKLHIVSHYVASLLGSRPGSATCQVLPIGRVGDDAAGHRLVQEMESAGIDVRWVAVDGERRTLTSVCWRYPDGSGGNVTARDSAADRVSTADISAVLPLLHAAEGRTIAVALPEVPMPVREHLLSIATDERAYRVASFTCSELDTALASGVLRNVDLLALNEDEATVLAGRRFEHRRPAACLRACADVLHAAQPDMRIIVSAGAHGAYVSDRGDWVFQGALPVQPVSAAGAGDALLAGVLAGLAAGMPLVADRRRDGELAAAFDLGVLLAAYSVTSPHTIHPQANLPSLLAFGRQLGVHCATTAARYLTTAPGRCGQEELP